MKKSKKRLLLALPLALIPLSLATNCGGTAQQVPTGNVDTSFIQQNFPRNFNINANELVIKVPQFLVSAAQSALAQTVTLINRAYPNYSTTQITSAFNIQGVSLNDFLASSSLISTPNNDPEALKAESDIVVFKTADLNLLRNDLLKLDANLVGSLLTTNSLSEFLLNGSFFAMPFSTQTPSFVTTETSDQTTTLVQKVQAATSTNPLVISTSDLELIMYNLLPENTLASVDLTKNQDFVNFFTSLSTQNNKTFITNSNQISTTKADALSNNINSFAILNNQNVRQVITKMLQKEQTSAQLLSQLRSLKITTLPKTNENVSTRSVKDSLAITINREKLLANRDFATQALKATLLENFLVQLNLILAKNAYQNNFISSIAGGEVALTSSEVSDTFNLGTMAIPGPNETQILVELNRLINETLKASETQNAANALTNQAPSATFNLYSTLVNLMISAINDANLVTIQDKIAFIQARFRN